MRLFLLLNKNTKGEASLICKPNKKVTKNITGGIKFSYDKLIFA